MMSRAAPHTPLPETRPKARRDRLILIGLGLLFLLGLYGLTRATDWQSVLAEFTRLYPWQILTLLTLSAANYALRGLRWHLFVRALPLAVPLSTNLVQFLGGFAMSLTPGRVGELVRLRWLSRVSKAPLDRAAPVMIADRASDLTALALLLGAALALSASAMRGAVPVACLALVTGFAATHPGLLRGLANAAFHASGRRAPRLFARLRRAARALSAFTRAGILLPALALGLLGWGAEAWSFQLLLHWLGDDISLARAAAIFIFATLAGGLTGAPGGLGGAEAAMVALLALDGTPLSVAIAATALIRVTTLWFAVALGILTFPLAERGTFSRHR